jgi:hypothetical protein
MVCADARIFPQFMPEPPFYARRVFTRAFHDTASFTQRKLSVSAFMAVIVRLAFWRVGQVQATWNGAWRELWHDSLIVVASYATVVLGSFIVNLFRAPALLDQERADEIAALAKENEALKQKQAVPEVSPQELRRRELVSAEAMSLGETGCKVLRYIHDHGQVHAMALDEHFGSVTVQAFVSKAIPSGLILYANHLIEIKPELSSAIEFILHADKE